ncbi:proteasome assembly chaperone 4 domain-containing protein [Hirsutella rhossiliensis]|uniref:Proteasome assembly chaperone 4 domain-containing protein n=1 Tax=Hirsutella rhossiliensis TaxID=111463 RepID=A0A9P8SDK1_9HYPO|nr:proteasome assembly chaperone 4 domain-containing protein [Hirsutella rhossiliensis]KAH0958833.1 proteasome assembly chaperone 4 domain-containing protein [Hirsutella rhossiliensis]
MVDSASSEPVQLSIPLPRSLDTRIYLRLSTHTKAVVLSLTTASQDELAASKAMGSFVYALPNRFDAQQPLSTTLFPHEPTVEFTTRLAKLIARRTQLPAYVTNSMSFADAGMGGTVEEEMEAFRSIVDVVLMRLRGSHAGSGTATEGAKS